MSDRAAAVALLRGLHLAGSLSLLGTAGFIAWILPAAAVVPDPLRRRLRLIGWISGVVALLAGAAWFTLEAADIADADTLSQGLSALPVVAAHTRFGTVLMVRLGLLLAATVLAATVLAATGPSTAARDAVAEPSGRWHAERPASPGQGEIARSPSRVTLYAALVLIGVALGLQGLIGHAGATAGAIGDGLVLSESLHLVAAGLWLGALLPLWFSLRALPPAAAGLVCERFSPIGLGCVLLLAGTGYAQGLQIIGSLPALFGTRYGHIALLKIALFLVTLMLAALNRLWLTDRLAAGAVDAGRRLRLSVSAEAGLGLAIIAAAAFMASAPPAAHTTPVSPFSRLFSRVAAHQDPGRSRRSAASSPARSGNPDHDLVMLTRSWSRTPCLIA